MRNKRVLALIMALSVGMVSITGCGKESEAGLSDESKKAMKEMEYAVNALENTGLIGHSDTAGKEETVYVLMDANGAKNETIVSEWLKNPNGDSSMKDSSTLNNLTVVKGDATFSETDNGDIDWSTDGNDVYYQGTIDKELPVDVNICYELDGRKVTAEEINNVSGHVTIKYDYTNNVKKIMEIGDEMVSIYQPFTTMTGMLFDDKKVANVKVTDGKVINSGDYTIVLGVAMPGLSESLGLDKINEEKDTGISIPESVTVEADVVDFSMPMSMTVITNDAINTLDMDKYDSIEDLKDKVNQLEDGMDQLIDGADQLDDGMHELSNGTGDLMDGSIKLDDGALELKNGTDDLVTGATDLNDGAGKLFDGTVSLHDGTVKLKNGLHTLNDKTPELASGVYQIKEGTDTLSAGVTKITDNNSALNKGASDLSTGISTLNKSLSSEDAGNKLAALVAGSGQINAGLSQMKDGAEALASQSEIVVPSEQVENIINGLRYAEQTLVTVSENGIASPEEDPRIRSIEGAITLLQKLADLVQAANGGIQLAKGITQIITVYPQIDGGIQEVASNMNTIKTAVGQLDTGAATLKTGISTYTNGVAQVGAGAYQLQSGVTQLNSKVPELVQGVSDLSNGADSLEAGACTLQNGALTLYDGTGKLKNGAFDLRDGSIKLHDGTAELRDGVDKLSGGVSQLVDGSGKLKDGVIEFNDEGISKIVDVVGDDLEQYYDRMCAVKDFSKEYTTYTGSNKNTEGSVKFIYKTDAVK